MKRFHLNPKKSRMESVETMEQADAEGAFLLMSLGFIVCALAFSVCGQPPNGDRRLENITNTFTFVIAIYVILSLHILHPSSWGKYAIRIFLGYIGGRLIQKFYTN
jgi:hypothetical protein